MAQHRLREHQCKGTVRRRRGLEVVGANSRSSAAAKRAAEAAAFGARIMEMWADWRMPV